MQTGGNTVITPFALAVNVVIGVERKQSRTPAASDLFGEKFEADPHGYWSELRSQAPVAWAESLRAWLVTDHALALEVFQSRDFSSDVYGRYRPSPVPIRSSFELDEAANVIFRKRIGSLIGSGGVAAERVRACCDARARNLQRDLAIEFVGTFAEPLAADLLTDWLALPARRRDQLVALLRVAESDPDPSWRRAAGDLVVTALLEEIEAHRFSDADDLLSRLALAWAEWGASDDDLAAFLSPMLFSLAQGIGTRLVVHAVAALLEHPELQDLIAVGGLPVARQAALEAARWEPVNKVTPRRALRRVELGNSVVEVDDTILIVLAAVCRDPRAHPDPAAFRLDRSEGSLAFGRGKHGCIGRELALLVAATALLSLFERGRLVAPPREMPDWGTGFGRACTSLPVVLIDDPGSRQLRSDQRREKKGGDQRRGNRACSRGD